MRTGPNIVKRGLVFHLDAANKRSIEFPYNYTIWKDGQTGAVGEFSTFSTNNERVTATDPFGNNIVVWQSSNSNDGTNVSGGGVYHNRHPIDNTKMYRMSFWEKRVSNSQNGGYCRYYFGMNGYESKTSSEKSAASGVFNRDNTNNLNQNPYFWNSVDIGAKNPPVSPVDNQLPLGVWTLVVGHIWPVGSGTGDIHPDSGLYTIDDERIDDIFRDFVWRNETRYARIRNIGVHSNKNLPPVADQTGAVHYTAYPRLDIIDGTEPSIQDLLDGKFDKTWYDLSGLGNHSTIEDLSTLNDNHPKSFEFDGIDDYITSGLKYSNFDNFTISSFFYNEGNGGSFGVLLGGQVGSNLHNGIRIDNDAIKFSNYDDGQSNQEIGSKLNDWVHVTVSLSSDNKLNLYMDGVKTNSIQYTKTKYDTTTIIGRTAGQYTGSYRAFKGKIADIKIYNRILTDEEVLQNYNAVKDRFGL